MNPAQDGNMNQNVDILLIGYGPAGATMANLLGQRGFSVAVVETADTIYDKPRAITADHEALRVFQQCGLGDVIAENTCPHPGTDFVGLQGQIIKRFYPAPGQPLAWEPTWMFVQPELEAKLRQGVERFAQVQVHLGHELISLEQDSDRVHAQVRRVHDGAALQFTARYAIACDGARSSVRRQMGGQIEDLAFDEWWIVVDAWLRSDTELPARCVQYCRPSRPGTYIVGPNDLRRWEIKMLPGETPEQFQTEAAIRRVLADFTDPDALDLCRTAIYRFHALVAQQWRFGRVFLMGDAAHQMPPFLGQGLCAAIRDTVNLAWKIEAVERQGASPRLLDTYGEERTPHVRTVVSHAKSFGLIIGELDEAKARQRDADMEAQLRSGQAETVRQKFIPGLTNALIALDAAGAPLPGAGSLFPQPWVQATGASDWRRLDDLTDGGFLLVSDHPEASHWIGQAAQTFWQRVGGQSVLVGTPAAAHAPGHVLALQERDGLLAQTLAQLDARVLLVRPDHYVYGCASTPAQLQALLASIEAALFDAAPLASQARAEPAVAA